MKSNCLLWGIKKRIKDGGKLHFCKSKYWFGFHCYWKSEDGEQFECFHCKKRFMLGNRLNWYQSWRLLLYEGEIRKGSKKEDMFI